MLNMVTVKIVFHLLVPIALLKQSASAPLLIGPKAERLTVQDIATIDRAFPDNAKPWLLIGDAGPTGGIQAFLPPTTNTPDLRRGQMAGLENAAPAWSIRMPTESYAQVAIPGRNFDQIT